MIWGSSATWTIPIDNAFRIRWSRTTLPATDTSLSLLYIAIVVNWTIANWRQYLRIAPMVPGQMLIFMRKGRFKCASFSNLEEDYFRKRKHYRSDRQEDSIQEHHGIVARGQHFLAQDQLGSNQMSMQLVPKLLACLRLASLGCSLLSAFLVLLQPCSNARRASCCSSSR